MEEKITLDPTTPRELQDEINHTKTETGAMAMVMEEWEKGMSRMQPYHRQWFLNTAYLLGFQHLVWHPARNRLWLPPSRRRQVRMTSNLMMSSYRINLSKLSTGITSITVLPNSNEQEDVDAARLGQTFDESLKTQENAVNAINLVVMGFFFQNGILIVVKCYRRCKKKNKK